MKREEAAADWTIGRRPVRLTAMTKLDARRRRAAALHRSDRVGERFVEVSRRENARAAPQEHFGERIGSAEGALKVSAFWLQGMMHTREHVGVIDRLATRMRRCVGTRRSP